ncbi:MAG: protease inhibitor I42 family protein [Hyphomicrobium sp.]
MVIAARAAVCAVAWATVGPGAGPEPVAADGQSERLPPIAAKAGVPVTVSLTGTAGTGYEWVPLEPLPASVRFIGSDYVSLSEPGRVGGKRRQILKFLMPLPGEADVVVVYKRPWEPGDAKDRKTFLKFICSK